ncbi:MAG: phytanoyl-CoA dioxygenase family protein [Planctomycetales bacterium]
MSEHHSPVSDLFQVVRSATESCEYELDGSQIEFFNEHGYVKGIRLFTDTQVESLRKELAGFLNPQHPGCELWYEYHSNESSEPDAMLFHALGAWRIAAGCHDALWNPAFTIPASQLLGGAVRFWHDQLFCKPARQGGVVAWHQDYSYWTRTGPMAHLTCWIGLDDTNIDNGCLHYVPGSHRWKLLPTTELAGDMEGIKKILTAEQWSRFQNPEPVEMKVGEASFHHPLTMHGSFANRSAHPRRAIVINVVRNGVKSLSDEPLLEGTDVIPQGHPLGGRFYPLLFDPDQRT